MENTKHEEKMKELRAEIRLLKLRRTEKNRPTVWYNKENGHIEIHFNNKTILADTSDIDTETSREDSDRMAEGSGFKEIIYTRNDTPEEEDEWMNKKLKEVSK